MRPSRVPEPSQGTLVAWRLDDASASLHPGIGAQLPGKELNREGG